MLKEKKIKKKHIVILGAGPSGLCAAYNLLDKFDVTILEKESHVAGLASCFKYNGKTIPKYYHHIFHHDWLTRKYFALVSRIKKLRWQRIYVGICANKKTYSFTDPISLLSFNYLSLWGRVRYGLFGFYVLFLMNPSRIPDKMGAEDWLMKKAGREVTKKIFYHLYSRNKFNIPLNEISAKQFAYRLKAKEATGIFGFPRAGLHTLFEGFEDQIKKRKGRILKSIRISRVDLQNKEITYKVEKSANSETEGKKTAKKKNKTKEKMKTMKYDILINTIPVPEFLKIQKGLPQAYEQRLSSIKYCPVVSVVFSTDKFLSRHYWLNLFNERVQIIMQHSILNDDFDHKISWASRYGGSEEDLPLDEEFIKQVYLNDVKKFFPKVNILWSRVFKEKYAEPVYDKTYFDKKPHYKTPVKDFYYAGIALTYPKIRNINTALESGEIVAKVIKKDHLNN